MEENFLKRVQANIVVMDFAAACEEAHQGLLLYPQSQDLFVASIKALAYAGEEKEMWNVWNRYVTLFPESAETNQETHEIMAWGVIWKASDSSLPMIRLCAMIGAYFSNDAKGATLLKRYCGDPNTLIRGVVVKLISHMHDAHLCDEVLVLLTREKNARVRLEVIKAVGKMRLRKGHQVLLALVANDQTSKEEKTAAIAALLNLLDTMERSEIVSLANSNRAGLRLLACEVVSHLRSQRDIDLITQLVLDNHSEVRAAALYTLGLLATQKDANLIRLAKAKLKDLSTDVAINAAWLLTRLDPDQSKGAFTPFINHAKRDVRLQASAALAATGKQGISYALELFNECTESLLKMNLAIGLIYQQTETLMACQALQEGLSGESGRLMWKETSPFRVLAPSTVKQEEDISNAPEAINQMTRLEILNILAVMKFPGAEDAIREFLKQRKWGITGLAAALLLMEGDENSLELVQGLLKDSNPRIQMQAALTLALWGGREEAINLLQAGYIAADRETKEKILEGLGNIGSRKSIPFLLDRLQESQQILRLIAASSLLQCLYH